jgi:hydroxypyruvate isomerase
MARTMVEGLRRSGRELTREKLVASLENLNNVDLGGYRMNYSPAIRHGSRFVELTVIGPGGKVLR